MEPTNFHKRRALPPDPPDFDAFVQSYTIHGTRLYLAQLLRIWSPAIDPDHSRMGVSLHHAICTI